MNQIAQDMNSKAQYSYNDNRGKSEPNFDMAGGKQKAMENCEETRGRLLLMDIVHK